MKTSDYKEASEKFSQFSDWYETNAPSGIEYRRQKTKKALAVAQASIELALCRSRLHLILSQPIMPSTVKDGSIAIINA